MHPKNPNHLMQIAVIIRDIPHHLPANLPGQFSLFGQMFLHWAAATLKGQVEFQNKKFKTTFHHHFLPENVGFKI